MGQRKGLGLSFPQPHYVVRIDAENNEVVLGVDGEQYAKELIATDVNWISIAELKEPVAVEAKIRYQARPAKAIVQPRENGQIRVAFLEPQRSITPGQAVVFYQGDIVMGGGTISRSL